jgi:hypothetical protein
MYQKSNHNPYFQKGSIGNRILGAVKGAASILDEPVIQSGIGLLSPELGAGLATARRFGILEKAKNM